ncbi:MAG: hypothetical protein JOY71_29510 [Acetobacteraceae bacterium]|nr:hypothetical protein [Acetobacteraceae bacterium]MBV8526200.1 hypothetical protein [Acetobacteraceae bacterium]MBV8590919.1 hypothetical protein [Acetobacteraceae bacterium]
MTLVGRVSAQSPGFYPAGRRMLDGPSNSIQAWRSSRLYLLAANMIEWSLFENMR